MCRGPGSAARDRVGGVGPPGPRRSWLGGSEGAVAKARRDWAVLEITSLAPPRGLLPL